MTKDALRAIFPNTVENIVYSPIDLDFTGMTIPDILRNWNKLFPTTSRERNLVSAGRSVHVVLLKSEYLDPYRGILLVFTDDQITIPLQSRNYLVFAINEQRLLDDDDITALITRFTAYLAKYCRYEMPKLKDFYSKYVYDPHEKEIEDEEIFGKHH